MTLWANLPLLVCLVFAVAIVIGLVVIVWKNQQVTREKEAWELAQKQDREL